MRTIRTVTTIALLALGATGIAAACGDNEPGRPGIDAANGDEAPDYDYLIPAGTGARLDAGDLIEIIPAELEVRVGEVLRIVNDDDRGHVIGAFYVSAGETLTQTFSTPGELSGECSVHPSGSFTLTVLA